MSRSRAVFVLLAGALIACATPSADEAESATETSALADGEMPACGTKLASFDGVDAYSNGGFTGTGDSCGGTLAAGYRYQCVELAMRYFSQKYRFSWVTGVAGRLLDTAPRDKVDVFVDGDAAHPPVPGDMLVWKNAYAGHVALVTRVTGSSIDVIEQNVKGRGTATVPFANGRVGTRYRSWTTAGWIHAKANTRPPAGGTTSPPAGSSNRSEENATRDFSALEVTAADVVAGESSPITIRIKNTGSTTWDPASRIRLGIVAPNEAVWSFAPSSSTDPDARGAGGFYRNASDGRVFLAGRVAPGATVTFSARIAAPARTARADRLKIAFRMVQEGAGWFGQTATREVKLCSAAACAGRDGGSPEGGTEPSEFTGGREVELPESTGPEEIPPPEPEAAPPPTADAGCSAAPVPHRPSGLLALGLLAALGVLRRRTRRSAHGSHRPRP